MSKNDSDAYEYSIGAVARMTGLTTHTIRKWEERYEAISPFRSPGGDRRYSSEQVARLTLIRELVEAGATLREVATLDTESLRRMSTEALGGPGVGLELVRVGVMGESLPTILEQHRVFLPDLQIVPLSLPLNGATDHLDAIVLEQPTMDEDIDEQLAQLREATGVACIVVVYGYARQTLAVKVSSATTACMRAPINYRELQRTVLALVSAAERSSAREAEPALRYSKSVLARVASLPSTVVCECPRHIAELIFALSDFETYSADCESRNDKDALIHAYLKQTAGHARAAFETALATVASHEDIPVDEWQAQETTP